MSTIENGDISLQCYFNKIIKGPGTSFQSLALKQKHVTNVDSTQDSSKNKHKCNFHQIVMPIMTSQILKSVVFTKAQNIIFTSNNKNQ